MGLSILQQAEIFLKSLPLHYREAAPCYGVITSLLQTMLVSPMKLGEKQYVFHYVPFNKL